MVARPVSQAQEIPARVQLAGEAERSSRFERPDQMQHAIPGGRLAMTDVEEATGEVRQRPSEATREIAVALIRQRQATSETFDSAALLSTIRNSAPVSYSPAMSSSERSNSPVSAKDRRVIELRRATVTSLTRSPSGTSCCCIALVRSISAASRSRTNALSLVEYSPSRRRLKRSLSNACQAPDMSSKDGLPETF